MATLAIDTPRTYELGDHSHYPVVATDIIYEGAAVGLDGSGDARPLNAGDKFVGFALYKADNSTGTAGAIKVEVKVSGQIQLDVANAAATDVGKAVYASDDNTFVLTASTNSKIGTVKRYVSSGVAVVAFDAAGNAGIITGLTTSVGTASDTIADVGAAFNQTTLNNIVASLAAKINALVGMNK